MKAEISFAAIRVGLEEGTLNDTNNPVWLGCVASMEDAKEMTDWFREIKLIGPDSEVTNIQHITGNVKGEDGRYDIMLTISGKGVINPLVRLQVQDLKWLSDFVDNYEKDYFLD